MSASGLALGNTINVVGAASGVSVPLTRYDTATCISYIDTGAQIITVTEVDSTGTNAEQALDVTYLADYKAPGIGGTWSAGPGDAAGVFDLADDATNDCLAITVTAAQLSDGYDSVQFTSDVDGGTDTVCLVILTDPKVQRTPPNLTSTLTA